VTVRPFGTLPDGRHVDLYSITADGIELHAMTYGGIITSLKVPDRYGEPGEVVLGQSDVEPYLLNASYFGAIIGRYANRIANGRFVLGENEYQLVQNDGANQLHGGRKGFDQPHWNASPITTPDGIGVTFSPTSPVGEEHYPGTLSCSVTYLLIAPGSVELQYDAGTWRSRPCVRSLRRTMPRDPALSRLAASRAFPLCRTAAHRTVSLDDAVGVSD